MRRILIVGATILLTLIIIGVQPTHSVISVYLDAEKSLKNEDVLEVHFSVDRSPHLYEMIISAIPVDSIPNIPGIVILNMNNQKNIPPSLTGLYDHITADLSLKGLSPNVSITNFKDMDFKEISNYILIISEPTDIDEDVAADFLSWVLSGGRLICIGPDSLPFRQKLDGYRWTGRDDFLRISYRELNYSADAVEESIYAKALSLQTSAPQWALEKQYLDEFEAVMTGHIHHDSKGSLVTSAMLELENGRLILFGGPIKQPAITSGDVAISWDISQLILSGALWSVGEPDFLILPLDSAERSGIFHTSLNEYTVVMAYSSSTYVPIYGRIVAAIS